jgi:hypothetical protein
MATIGTGKDYSTVASWEAVIDDDQFGGDETGEVYGLTEDNSSISFNGLDPNGHWVILKAASGEETDGKDGTGARIDVYINLDESTKLCKFRMEGIEQYSASSHHISVNFDANGSEVEILKCTFRGAVLGIKDNGCGDVYVRVGACLFRDIRTNYNYGVRLTDTSIQTEYEIINCTFYDNYSATRDSSDIITKMQNCATYHDETADSGFYDYRNGVNVMDYCAGSGDGTVTGGNSIDTLADDDTDFTDTSTEDFTPVAGGVLTNTGSPVSGSSWFPATDMVGVAWDASNPSMGCFELAAAGGGTEVTKAGSLTVAGAASRHFAGSRTLTGEL